MGENHTDDEEVSKTHKTSCTKYDTLGAKGLTCNISFLLPL